MAPLAILRSFQRGRFVAWRVIDAAGETWHVHPAAERRPNASLWQLVLSFRSQTTAERRAFWAPFPIESVSKTSLFYQAERIPDDALRELIVQRHA